MFPFRLYALMSLLLVVAILMTEAEHTRSDVFQYDQKGQGAANDRRQYCGRSLSTALQIICSSIYNPRFKKSNEETEMDDYMAYSYDLHPYESVENARKMIKLRRYSRGIYEECCLKACTTEELRSYCGTR